MSRIHWVCLAMGMVLMTRPGAATAADWSWKCPTPTSLEIVETKSIGCRNIYRAQEQACQIYMNGKPAYPDKLLLRYEAKWEGQSKTASEWVQLYRKDGGYPLNQLVSHEVHRKASCSGDPWLGTGTCGKSSGGWFKFKSALLPMPPLFAPSFPFVANPSNRPELLAQVEMATSVQVLSPEDAKHSSPVMVKVQVAPACGLKPPATLRLTLQSTVWGGPTKKAADETLPIPANKVIEKHYALDDGNWELWIEYGTLKAHREFVVATPGWAPGQPKKATLDGPPPTVKQPSPQQVPVPPQSDAARGSRRAKKRAKPAVAEPAPQALPVPPQLRTPSEPERRAP